MKSTDKEYSNCIRILNEELLPAFGCTEPIAVAYAAALAKETLGQIPNHVIITCSGNIFKNVKSVVVPNSGNMKGLRAAAAAGIIAGCSEKKLEVLSSVTEDERARIREYIHSAEISIELSKSSLPFDIIVEVSKGEDSAVVRIAHFHTNVVLITRNDTIIRSIDINTVDNEDYLDRSFLSTELIFDFANSVDPDEVRQLLNMQISYNMAIAEEGLKGDYGANIGSVILNLDRKSLRNRIKAMAAAGSDARMNGCEMPVIINSGSGNQGIAVCTPIVVYARDKNIEEDKIYRALSLANLLSIHQRFGIGCLSAYCGAINAGIASICGIAYLEVGTLDAITHTLVNGLAVASGVICDGAKASCASKIVMGIEAGLIGLDMYHNGQQFCGGDGIVKVDVEATIAAVARLARYGMRETDREILNIMMDS